MAIQEGLYRIYYRCKIGAAEDWQYNSSFITHLHVTSGEPLVKANGNPISDPTYVTALNSIHDLSYPVNFPYRVDRFSDFSPSVGNTGIETAFSTMGLRLELPSASILLETDTVYLELSLFSDFSITWGGNWRFGGGNGWVYPRLRGYNSGNNSRTEGEFFWLQYSELNDMFYMDYLSIESATYGVCSLGGPLTGYNNVLKNSFDSAEPWTQDFLTVTELPSGSATYTVTTEGTIDTVTISINEGYVLNSIALYDPTDRLVQRWKELPEGSVIQVRRDQPGVWTMRITCQEILSPYNPTTPIEDLPSDTITPTYPTDYIGKYIGAGFYKLFIPTVAQLNAFVNYLYTQTFMDAIMQLWNKMLGIEEMIVGVNIIPGTPGVAGTAVPKVGWVSMTESQAMNYTVQQYLEINLGSLTVSRAWGNYLDFAPYTKISIYLPFIGERTLDTNDVMCKTLNVRYHIDLLSGNCVAYVYVGGSIHYQFSGNCAYSIPISSADTANLFLQPLKAIAGMTLAGVGVATGNPMAMVAGNALGATIGSDENGTTITPPSAEISAPDVRKVDGLNANTGYMGTIRPYLSIERVKPDINAGFGAEIGYQSNKFRTLGNLAGFTKVSEVHLEGITATTAELTQIEAMLKEGVII